MEAAISSQLRAWMGLAPDVFCALDVDTAHES